MLTRRGFLQSLAAAAAGLLAAAANQATAGGCCLPMSPEVVDSIREQLSDRSIRAMLAERDATFLAAV